jgi:hypothetical protein
VEINRAEDSKPRLSEKDVFMTMEELITRLEGAERADPRLDNDICEALLGWPEREWRSIDYMKAFGLAVTSSVDAAISLVAKVLPGRSVMMGWRQTSETRPWARVGLWADPDATGATPAIALCLATLRALQAKTGDRT